VATALNVRSTVQLLVLGAFSWVLPSSSTTLWFPPLLVQVTFSPTLTDTSAGEKSLLGRAMTVWFAAPETPATLSETATIAAVMPARRSIGLRSRA
jgi:hypothetical protein